MRPGQPVDSQLALVLEAKVTCAFGQLLDDGRGEDLPAAGLIGDTRRQDDVLAVEVGLLPDRLAGMEPDPQPDRTAGRVTELGRDRALDRARTLDGAAGAGERDHEAVALRLHLESPWSCTCSP